MTIKIYNVSTICDTHDESFMNRILTHFKYILIQDCVCYELGGDFVINNELVHILLKHLTFTFYSILFSFF